MNIYLAHVPEVPEERNYVSAFRRQLNSQRHPRRFFGVDDPADADLILFTECHQLASDWRLQAISRSQLAHSYPDRVAVYNQRDRPWCSLPGVYVNMPKRSFRPRWQVAGSYWHIQDPAERVDAGFVGEPRYLYSFVGGASSQRCRLDIFRLPRSSRSCVELVEDFAFTNAARMRRFAEVLFESAFVLCPRGLGTSTYRLFEVLAAGRAPVIISDDWVAPNGPDWGSFSIRWPEARIPELPAALERRQSEAPAMGLTRQMSELASLLDRSTRSEFPVSGFRDAEFLRTAGAELLGSARSTLAKSRVAKSAYRAIRARRARPGVKP
jgi:hypothetical protein